MYAFANLLNTIISLYIWCLFIFVILGWLVQFGVINTQNRVVYLVMDFLYRITEPALRPIRRFVPNLGGIDISPILLVLVLIFIRDFVVVDLVRMFG
ncbi:MAG: YggT family protein [Alphaproteobacteria bacterium]|jgi:YggT family protein|nr:YggT family protein [Alphaproteobacteria bacterium]